MSLAFNSSESGCLPPLGQRGILAWAFAIEGLPPAYLATRVFSLLTVRWAKMADFEELGDDEKVLLRAQHMQQMPLNLAFLS